MPKTNYGGATAYGLQGVVEDAYGKRSELDPSLKLDGTAVDDFDSEERDIDDPAKSDREGLAERPPYNGEPGVREDSIERPEEFGEEKGDESADSQEAPTEPKREDDASKEDAAKPAARRTRATK